MGDGAGSDVFSFTGAECAQLCLADKGTIDGHDVSGDAAACVGVSSKIAVNPPCQNGAVFGARVAIRQALVVGASRMQKHIRRLPCGQGQGYARMG